MDCVWPEPYRLGIPRDDCFQEIVKWGYAIILELRGLHCQSKKYQHEGKIWGVLSKKRSDLYFTISEDERKALASVQRIERKVALKKPKK
jgi:hypothetical protein